MERGNRTRSVRTLDVVGSIAYVADGRAGLQVIDVSDPTDPTLVASYNTRGWANSITIYGDKVYAADGYVGLIILKKFKMLRIGPASVEADGRIRLPVDGESGQRVRLQRSENLVDWEDWQTMTLGGNATACGLIDTTTETSHRFYRVVEDEPTLTDDP